jgi:hypothetical protein
LCFFFVCFVFVGCANVGDKFFSSFLSSAASLLTLNLCGCAQLTSKSMSSVAKLPKLTCLDLSFCDKIDDKGVAMFLKHEQLCALHLKGVAARCDERTLRRLTAAVLDKTLADLAGASANGFYDLTSDALVARKLKSPRLSASAIPPLDKVSFAWIFFFFFFFFFFVFFFFVFHFSVSACFAGVCSSVSSS